MILSSPPPYSSPIEREESFLKNWIPRSSAAGYFISEQTFKDIELFVGDDGSKEFTEWTNIAKSHPMFRGHYQPHIPADLGFYDLRVPETRIAQAEMAKEYGIEAFCYYHYWFAGKRLLERPFNEVLKSGEPDFPFCLCWANETWTGIWHGNPERALIEQTYPGLEDHRLHFTTLLEAFRDRRYLTVEEKPLFLIYRPQNIPDLERVIELWREMAFREGLKGLYVVGASPIVPGNGIDAFVVPNTPQIRGRVSRWKPLKWLREKYNEKAGKPTISSFEKVMFDLLIRKVPGAENYPCLIPNWDNTPRSGSNGLVLHQSTPELFRLQVKRAKEMVQHKRTEHKIIFIKSWNEWAEGNHLEPDLKFGKVYLQVLKEEIFSG